MIYFFPSLPPPQMHGGESTTIVLFTPNALGPSGVVETFGGSAMKDVVKFYVNGGTSLLANKVLVRLLPTCRLQTNKH